MIEECLPISTKRSVALSKKQFLESLSIPEKKKVILDKILDVFSDEEICANQFFKVVIGLLCLKMKYSISSTIDAEYKNSLEEFLGSTGNSNLYAKLSKVDDLDFYECEELIAIIYQSRHYLENGSHEGHSKRKKSGVFFTPYEVARLIAKEGMDLSVEGTFLHNSKKNQYSLYCKLLDLRIIDPACGTGIILSAAIEYLLEIYEKISPSIDEGMPILSKQQFTEELLSNSIYGVDIDEEACEVAKLVLSSRYNFSPIRLINSIKSGDALVLSNSLFSQDFSIENWFSDIFDLKDGFDLLLMNPPYERLKVDKSEYKNISNSDDLYQKEKFRIEKLVAFIRSSKNYPLSANGVLDLYKLFIERAIQITHEKGAVSFIVPFSLLGDVSCKKLRDYILEQTKLGVIYCFKENIRLFHNVSQAFCIVSFYKSGTGSKAALYEGVKRIRPLEYERKLNIDKADINAISPKSKSIPITDDIGWKILKKIHQFPSLLEIDEIVNSRGELDLTFGKKYLSSNSNEEVLIRGNVISAYKLKNGDTSKESYVCLKNMVKDSFLGNKMQYVNSERLVCQQISNMGIKRRLKFSLINRGVVANSCNFLFHNSQGKDDLMFLLGILNSSLLNWRFKLSSTNNHINNYELDELPIITRSMIDSKLTFEVIDLVEKLYSAYNENTQELLDEKVFLMYGLNNNESKYIKEH